MKKVIGLMIGLLPVFVNAECVPVPDCASIGYTETSCEGDSLKCPFDTTKLYCPPCDSSYKYTCSGDNIKNPIGDTCNNKYAACECIAGATFTNGECICNTSCDTIGNIYYSDGTCNSCKISDKIPVGIIAYKNESKHLIISLETNIKMPWSTAQKDANETTIIPWDRNLSSLEDYTNSTLASQDYNGNTNTQTIVEAYGENATGVAAVYCYNYAPTEMANTKGQWYLPAAGELYKIATNNKRNINKGLATLELNSLNMNYHWSSSEYNAKHSYSINFSNNTIASSTKYQKYIITCFLAL